MHLRFQPKPRKPRRKWLVGVFLLAGLGGLGVWQRARLNAVASAIAATVANGKDNTPTAVQTRQPQSTSAPNDAKAAPTVANADANAESPESEPTLAADTADNSADKLLNHRRYEVVNPDTLVPLNPNSIIRLKPDAQATILKMIAKAKAEGVQLGIISGFRTLEDQNYLYFDLKAERGESAKTRAEVSAPPGYSEHHTGYAVDFIDESKPETHLEESFETTAAFKWLEQNAAFFNFEMSFPKGNEANVGYEPWHWRYVGNQESLELFYK